MKRIILTIITLLSTLTFFAQTQNGNQTVSDISSIQKTIDNQKIEIQNLKSKISSQDISIKDLINKSKVLKSNFQEIHFMNQTLREKSQ
jgi:cell division protein FtsB